MRHSRDLVQGKIEEEIKTIVTHEVDQVRWRLSQMTDPRSSVLAARQPSTLLSDIFALLANYLPGHQNARVNAFLQLVCHQEHVKRMFLLAVYVGGYGIERLAREVEQERSRDEQAATTPQFARPQPEFFHRTHGEMGTLKDTCVQCKKALPIIYLCTGEKKYFCTFIKFVTIAKLHPNIHNCGLNLYLYVCTYRRSS